MIHGRGTNSYDYSETGGKQRCGETCPSIRLQAVFGIQSNCKFLLLTHWSATASHVCGVDMGGQDWWFFTPLPVIIQNTKALQVSTLV